MATPSLLYVLEKGQQTGPHAVDELRQRIESGELSSEDLVWCEGMPEWVAVGSVLGLASADVEGADPVTEEVGEWVEEPGFGARILDALAYPFRGDGFLILFLGTVFFTVISFLTLFSWIIAAAAWGYLLLMLQQVLHSTAMGEDRVPNWPDIDGLGQLFGKTIQWFGVFAVCFAPGLGFLLFVEESETGLIVAGCGILLMGLLIAPMALLSVGMHDTLNAASPVFLFRTVARAPGQYALMIAVFAGLIGFRILTGKLGQVIPIAGLLFDKLDEIWTAVFVARVLGSYYHVNRRRFSWFGE